MDFHTHTIYSDGINSPKGLVRTLKLSGIDIMAKTDHDTILGYLEAKKEADKWGLILIPGVEITEKDYHILGFNFNPKDKKFLSLLEKSKEFQKENTRQRIEILSAVGLPISIEKVEAYFPHSRLGTYNIFMTMLRDKECRKWVEKKHPDEAPKEIMSYYFTRGGIADEISDKINLEAEKIIEGIHDAGGLAILAHPAKDVKDLIELDKLRELGIDGIEIQPNFYEQYPLYEEYAKKHNLLITYGSDYHGANFNRALLGRGMNKLSSELEERLALDYENYENFEVDERGLVCVQNER